MIPPKYSTPHDTNTADTELKRILLTLSSLENLVHEDFRQNNETWIAAFDRHYTSVLQSNQDSGLHSPRTQSMLTNIGTLLLVCVTLLKFNINTKSNSHF